jgi:hypothetical protein
MKSEIQNPKFDTNSNPEVRNGDFRINLFRTLTLGFASNFGFRVSNFACSHFTVQFILS